MYNSQYAVRTAARAVRVICIPSLSLQKAYDQDLETGLDKPSFNRPSSSAIPPTYKQEQGHLVSDLDVGELHHVCSLIGIPRWRFHGVHKGHPHYDLPTARLKSLAILIGKARIVGSKELVRRMARS